MMIVESTKQTNANLKFASIMFVGCICLVTFMLPKSLSAQSRSLTKYVDPFIGTAPGNPDVRFHANNGDVFPGATYPRGMVQWSPDTQTKIPGGYFYHDGVIKGFSVRHFSGRGCDSMQDIAFMPQTGAIKVRPQKSNLFHGVSFSHENEEASPGYYSVKLNNDVKVKLSVTERTGIGTFIFPKASDPKLMVNAGSSITGTTPNTAVKVVGENQIEGYATSTVGCGDEKYTIYFVARFNHPFNKFETWNDNAIDEGVRFNKGRKVGAILNFNNLPERTIKAKIGISFVSVENAKLNLEEENSEWNFDRVKKKADSAWNNVLNKIVVSGGTLAQKRTFYTALYHCYFHPNIFSDVNGEYIGMDNKVHEVHNQKVQYENIPGWDMYRSLIQLDAILSPDVTSDIMQSLVNNAQQGGGGLPRWQQANHNSGGMVGDGPVILLASAYAFGAKSFDTNSALEAMKLNAGSVGTTSDGHLVREGLADYIDLGYVPLSASKTLEYNNADFALSQFAKAMNDSKSHKLYLKRSGSWKSLYNSSTGYIQPRNKDGSWVKGVEPDTREGYTEGSASQYTWMVPFDMQGLINEMGGDSTVIARLDLYFKKLNDGPLSPYAYMGNEFCEGNPWIYNFAGAPYKSQKVVRRIQNQLFNDTPNGLPGNDDGGALSSWYVFSALGMYPEIPGTDILTLSSPLFEKAVLHLKNGDVTIIGNSTGENSIYIQQLTINGKEWTKPWIHYSNISPGDTLNYNLSPTPNEIWGSEPSDLPPSYK